MKIRNPIALNPLLRKSHVHKEKEDTKKAQRKALMEELFYDKPLLNPRNYLEY